MDRGLSFTVLGPVTARRHDRELELGSPQQRAMLAALLLREGAPITSDELAGALWADDVPASAATTIRTYVYRLRRALGDDTIRSAPGGYLLPLEPGELDLSVFRRHLADAETAGPDGAVRELTAALALFAGTPLAGLPGPYAERQRDALDRLRVSAHDARLQAELDRGGHARITDELAGLIADRPLDERLREMHMVALYRSGRQADALAAYQDTRRRLADELGVDPGAALQALHERILRADPDLLPATAPPAVAAQPPPVAQLPPDLGAFAGRTEELEAATRLLAEPGRGPVTVLVAGTAGVGKTTFAVHWAHRVADRFPAGQIYVNLRGFDPTGPPTPPADAIRIVLQSLGVGAEQLPTHPDAQWALYRSMLAERRIILLLDNARDAQQVRPLLAGGPGGLVIVTSRAQLGGLVVTEGAHPVPLGVLGEAEARDLLTRRLGAARMAGEADAVREIVFRCARLPLALAVVAARAATRPGFRLGDIAAELGGDGLDALDSGDPSTDARSVFSWSYAALSPATARMFRLLALHPGPDITVAAAAALAGVTARETRRALAELADAVLIEERRPGRYVWHDLLRAYAGEVGAETDPAADRDAARRRLLDHLVRGTANVAALLNPHRPRYTPALAGDVAAFEPDGYADAMAWSAIEGPVLMAAVVGAAAAGFPHHAWHLAHELEPYQVRVGNWLDAVHAQEIALRSARETGDALLIAQAHHSLAKALRMLGRFDEAYTEVTAAVTAFRAAGHGLGEAGSLLTLGDVAGRLGRIDEARERYEAGIEMCRTLGHTGSMAAGLNNYALLLTEHGLLDRAVDLCRQALIAWDEIGDRFGAAYSRESLGVAYLRQGRHDLAVPVLSEAVRRLRELGGPLQTAEGYAHLGEAQAAGGDIGAAVTAWRAAEGLLASYSTPSAVELREHVQEHLARHPG